ncbi:MAG: DUF115 domain-containing protein [Anaerolineaceae bacterium]|nr:DUF115 domain-containing protein [Anaerolineaceae bacterium]
MAGIKTTVKKIIPEPLWKLGSDSYWYWRNRGRHDLARQFSPRWRQSLHQLEAYKDKHKGQRCFIMGNGPSLNKTDLDLIRDEVTFGLNRIYLLFPKIKFETTYLVSVNDLVLEQTASEMTSLDLPKFVTWRARKWMRNDPTTMFLDSDFTGLENFSGDAINRIFEGFTVTYVALQLAYYMGFETVILIGVDHNFTTKGKANEAVVSQGDDPNHFAPNYFGKGFKWQLPDLDGSERAYRLAKEAYSASGRQVLDATIDGKLTVFPKVDYSSLF